MTSKITSERSAKLVQELALLPGNDICADCKTKAPRWTSHNLGIFLCVHCASIHRKIGTHITKVKSVTMDSWTKEQAENMKNIGNVKSNAIFNPNETRHPPPPPLMDATRDNELEQYIRSKYEYKRFIDKSALVASKLGPSRSATSISAPRPQTTPLEKPAPAPARPSTATLPQQARSASQPLPQVTASTQPSLLQSSFQPTQSSSTMYAQQVPQAGVWADLVSLQAPSASSSLPLQYQQTSVNSTASYPMMNQFQQQPTMTMGMGYQQQQQPPSFNPYGQQNQQQFAQPQHQQMQYLSNQVQVQSPVAQPSNYMFAPQPQMQYSTTPQIAPMMSTTPQFMSTTPQIQVSHTPQLQMSHTPQMQMSHTPQMQMAPSPNNMFMPQQQQQQQQQQYSLPPMGGGAWPQPMYQQQQMQQGQWSAM